MSSWRGLLASLMIVGCSNTETQSYPQARQDAEVALGITQAIDRLFLTGLAALPPGAVDVVLSCTAGGTVHAVGSASRRSDGFLASRDLRYGFSACRFNAVTAALFRLELSGELHESGTYSESDGVWSVSSAYESTQLSVTASGLGVPAAGAAPVPFAVTEICPVTLAQVMTGSTGSLKGSLCGRSIHELLGGNGGIDGGVGGPDGGTGSCSTSAEELGCCTVSGGVRVVGVTVPAACTCPEDTCFTLYDRLYEVNQCGCTACGGCP